MLQTFGMKSSFIKSLRKNSKNMFTTIGTLMELVNIPKGAMKTVMETLRKYKTLS